MGVQVERVTMRKTILGTLIAFLTLLGALALTQTPASAADYRYGIIATVDSSYTGRPCQVAETVFTAGTGNTTLGFKYHTVDIPPAGGNTECYSDLVQHGTNCTQFNCLFQAAAWYVQLNYLQVNNSSGAATVVSYPLQPMYNGSFGWHQFNAFTNTSQYHFASPNLVFWRCTAPGWLSNPPASTTNCVTAVRSWG